VGGTGVLGFAPGTSGGLGGGGTWAILPSKISPAIGRKLFSVLPTLPRLAAVPFVVVSSVVVPPGLAWLAAAPNRDSVQQQQAYHSNLFMIEISRNIKIFKM
jgi:hypothetical protein